MTIFLSYAWHSEDVSSTNWAPSSSPSWPAMSRSKAQDARRRNRYRSFPAFATVESP